MRNKPHVILIMADQLRRDCISYYGNLSVRTPHMDRLSGESICFDNAYCAAPLCTPTRVSIYTGKWPHTHGAIINPGPYEEERQYGFAGPEHMTLYECLDRHGYEINHIGINHCRVIPSLEERVPNARFHSEWYNLVQSHAIQPNPFKYPEIYQSLIPTIDYCAGKPVQKHLPPPRVRTVYPHDAEKFKDMFWANEAEKRIETLNWNAPQFLEVLFWAPHPPFIVPEPYFSMYPPETIELPETVGRWYHGQPGTLLAQVCGALGTTTTREEYKIAWSAYFGLVSMVDECIGRVVNALKKKGVWEDSLIIFMSDHGEMLGCHHLYQKHCCYEEASHIPLFIKPPATGSGNRKNLVSHIDITPTICDYTGADLPSGTQGSTLRTVIEDNEKDSRNEIFIEYNGDNGRGTQSRAIVTNLDGIIYKYIITPGDIDELYDITDDPMEKNSLVDNAQYEKICTHVSGNLKRWMCETNDYLS